MTPPRATPTTLVFMYGSNLAPEQLRERCPSAEVVGVATLPNFALTFAGFSAVWEGAVATVVRQRGGSVEGIVARLTRPDLAALDRYEGVPVVYTRRRLVVALEAQSVRAHVYRLRADVPRQRR